MPTTNIFRVILTFLCWFSVQSFIAQEAIFAFALNPEGAEISISSEDSERFSHKFDHAQEVMSKLITAKGDFTLSAPLLIMNNGERMPASIDLNKAHLLLEEKAYDICASFGKDSTNALAILLAHELVHYYENHNWQDHFLHHYGEELNVSNQLITDNHLKLEVEADQMGGFLAKTAGYQTAGVLGPLLSRIYDAYNLDKEGSNNYPTLEERVSVAEKGEKKMREMSEVFEMANCLSMMGEFDLAIDYLNHILIKEKFTSRELHNNKGVLYGLAALQYFNAKEFKFIVPLQLDFRSRLSHRNVDLRKRNTYIRYAKDALKSSVMLDEDYLPSMLNLATVHMLQEEYFDAKYLCEKVLRSASDFSQEKVNAYVNLGIIAAFENDPLKSKNYFKQALDNNGGTLAQYNMKILEDEALPIISYNEHFKISIGDIDIEKVYASIARGELEAEFGINLKEDTAFFVSDMDDYDLLINLVDYGDKAYQIFQRGHHLIVGEYKLEKGDNVEKLLNLLELDRSHIKPSKMLHLDKYKLMIKLDEESQIEAFYLYSTKV